MTTNRNSRVWGGLKAGPVALLTILLCSCSQDGLALGDVEGTVTFDGKPLKNAVVIFVPAGEQGTTSSGTTDENGHYKLMFTFRRSGVMLGQHSVLIEASPESQSDAPDKERAGSIHLPAKYGKPGTLVAEVRRGSQTIDFELTSKK